MAYPVSFEACVEHFVSLVSTGAPGLAAAYEGRIPQATAFPYCFVTTGGVQDYNDHSLTASYDFEIHFEVISSAVDINEARGLGRTIASLVDHHTGSFTGGSITACIVTSNISFHGPNEYKHCKVTARVSATEP